MEINAALAAVLGVLSEALEDPDADVTETLRLLAADARSAVASYLGVAVTMTVSGESLVMTAMENGARRSDVRASIQIPVDPIVDGSRAASDIALILFAGRPGAFVDLSADLIWLSGRDASHVVLDQHLDLAARRDDGATVAAISIVNQAIGVLIARGLPPDRAELEIDRVAANDGNDRVAAARTVLDGLPSLDGRWDVGLAAD